MDEPGDASDVDLVGRFLFGFAVSGGDTAVCAGVAADGGQRGVAREYAAGGGAEPSCCAGGDFAGVAGCAVCGGAAGIQVEIARWGVMTLSGICAIIEFVGV